jgi:hypothetical protein
MDIFDIFEKKGALFNVIVKIIGFVIMLHTFLPSFSDIFIDFHAAVTSRIYSHTFSTELETVEK